MLKLRCWGICDSDGSHELHNMQYGHIFDFSRSLGNVDMCWLRGRCQELDPKTGEYVPDGQLFVLLIPALGQ